MDAITVIIILLSILAGGGASGAAVAAYRHYRRRAMREVLERERRHGGERLSLFDVFWDLGANDIALEMMRHEGLLPEAPGDLRDAHRRLEELLEAHGDYSTYVRETLEVIEEFEEVRRQGGDRRQIPALEVRGRKLLDVDGDSEGIATVDSDRDRLGAYVAEPLEQRVEYRNSERASGLRVHYGGEAAGGMLDVDAFGEMSPQEILGSVVEGRFTETLRNWWEQRRVRGLKSDLDAAFERLYDFYVEESRRRPDFYDDLFATADRWDEELERIEDLRDRRPLAGEPTGLAGQTLLELAAETARSIARSAEANTRKAIERIHAFARRGDFAMAGYLVYLNRNAFFAGRSPGYGSHVQRIENLAHRLQREVRALE